MTTDIIIHDPTLDEKYTEALLRVIRTSMGTTLAAAVPTPAFELSKALGIAIADAWMFWDIYRVYYDEPLSSERLAELLGLAGIIVVSGGVVSYATFKIGQAMINEVLNFIPVGGWLISAMVTGTTTLTLGLVWVGVVDSWYRDSR